MRVRVPQTLCVGQPSLGAVRAEEGPRPVAAQTAEHAGGARASRPHHALQQLGAVPAEAPSAGIKSCFTFIYGKYNMLECFFIDAQAGTKRWFLLHFRNDRFLVAMLLVVKRPIKGFWHCCAVLCSPSEAIGCI